MAIVYDSNIKTYLIGQSSTADSWLVSTWDAGQTGNMAWSANNITRATDGSINLTLNAAPTGSPRPYTGAEVQSNETATTGSWAWVAQAPKMQDGAVFGMFTYKADYATQPWVEFDFEFVGHDTTKVQLNIHMENPAGQHISLDQAKGHPVIVDLGFDASLAKHSYEVSVTSTAATFYVDGKAIGTYGGQDMPGGVWQLGPMKSFVDLWSVSPGQYRWAGTLNYNGTPLVGHFDGFDIRPNAYGPEYAGATPTPTPSDPLTLTLTGDAQDNTLTGTSANETLTGLGGNDTLVGGAGNDRLDGGTGNDIVSGGAGIDTITVTGSGAVTIDLRITGGQYTGYGTDTITGVENLTGNTGNDRLTGNSAANTLLGNGGADTLSGNAGADVLNGGAGRDYLSGGADTARDSFVFNSTSESAVGKMRDVIGDFHSGSDVIDLHGIDANIALGGDQSFAFTGTRASAHAIWYALSNGQAILSLDVTGDAHADMQVRLSGVSTLTGADFLF